MPTDTTTVDYPDICYRTFLFAFSVALFTSLMAYLGNTPAAGCA